MHRERALFPILFFLISCASQTVARTSNRRFLKLKEFIAYESNHETGLPHRRVTQQNELEMMHAAVGACRGVGAAVHLATVFRGLCRQEVL